jgi:hypothetical protein
MMAGEADEGQLIEELRRLEASARNYQQEVSQTIENQDSRGKHWEPAEC